MVNTLLVRRIKRGYTQQQFAKELRNVGEDCTQAEVCLYENGSRIPTLKRALAIAKILKCKVEEIYYLDDNGECAIKEEK